MRRHVVGGAVLATMTFTTSVWAQGSGADDRFETPRIHIAVSGGTSVFRGGDPSSFTPFQPDTESATAGGTIGFRLAERLVLEVGAAGAWGKEENGIDTPDNTFLTVGLKVPVLAGRFVPYLTLGGGALFREPKDEIDELLEDVFEVRGTDPLAYGGGGLEFRLTDLLGVRGDYRYLRVFPEGLDDLEIEREAYGVHQVTGGVTLSF